MKIGGVSTINNVFLAPMAGITDRSFRIICKENGAGLVYSEMVSAKGIAHNNSNTKNMLITNPEERPVAMQLFGSDPDIMGRMAAKLNDCKDIDIIDINMGCPAPKIIKNGEGSALMLKPDLIGDIVASVSEASNKPVTVKIRKGWDNEHVNAPLVARIAMENGASAVAVHGRTRAQYYSGVADLDIIREVRKVLVNIPLIGNGDITTPQQAKHMLDYTGCDAIMIGRGAQGDPFIFKRIAQFLETGELLPETSIKEKLTTALKHLDMLIADKGEIVGIKEMRKHLGWYTKGMAHSAALRTKINGIIDYNELKSLIEDCIYEFDDR